MEDVGLLVDQKVREHLRGKYKQMHEDCHARLVANICKDDPDLYDAWKYYHSRCNRTVVALHPNEKALRPPTILAHNALEDAKWQAKHLVNVAQALNLKLQ